LYVWSVWDAVRLARRTSAKALHAWQQPRVYALYVIASYVFVLAPSTAGVRRDLLEAFKVPSASLSPGILPGDRIFVDKTVGQPGGAKLWRGAIVVFIYPNDRTSIFIKRVIGLPGDRVEMAGNNLRVNGHSVSQGPAHEPLPSALAGLRAFRERGDRGEYTVLWPGDASDGSLIHRRAASSSQAASSSCSATIAVRPWTRVASAPCRWPTSKASRDRSGFRHPPRMVCAGADSARCSHHDTSLARAGSGGSADLGRDVLGDAIAAAAAVLEGSSWHRDPAPLG
jgi:signal peptidase I